MPENTQSFMEDTLPERAFSMRFARLIMRYRFATLMTLVSIALFFMTPLVNGIYFVSTGEKLPGIDTVFELGASLRDTFPEHPFIHASDKFTGRFGTASPVAIAVVKKEGEIYDPDFLHKVHRITNRIDEAPYVNHYQVSSLTHYNTRVIEIEPDGGIVANPLIDEIPEEEEELAALRDIVLQNPGQIYGLMVSRDHRAVLIRAGFITHRLDSIEGYNALFNYVMAIKADEEADGTVEIHVTGTPIATAWVLKHAFEIGFFLLLTIVMLFFLLLAYFRRLHGVAIPMVAGLATAIWGLGFCAWLGIKLDPLILVIPLLITARSISHTIQMAERFFEDYEMEADARATRLGRELTRDEVTETKVETATTAMAKLMLPGMLGIITDAAGLMVIFITTIQVMRNLAIFGSFWVLAIIFNVILLHPIMIAYLPPPHETKHYTWSFVSRVLSGIGNVATSRGKYAVVAIVSVLFVWATYYTLYNSTIGHSRPGAPVFWEDHEFNIATGEVAKTFGGVDQLTVFVDGDGRSASSNGYVLQRMEALERFMSIQLPGDLGGSVSIVNFIKAFWQGAHYGDPKWGFVPESATSIGGIIFNLINNSPPGALRPFLTEDSEDASVTFFFRDHKGTTIRRAVHWAEQFIDANPMGRVNVRLKQDPSEFLDVIYYMIGPILLPRHHSMQIEVAQIDDQQEIQGYVEAEPTPVDEWTEPISRDDVVPVLLAEFKLIRRNKDAELTEASHLRYDLEVDPNRLGKTAKKLSAQQDWRIETARYKADEVAETQWMEMTIGAVADYIVDRSVYQVRERWDGGEDGEIHAQSIRFCTNYCDYELWVKNDKFKDASWNPQPTKSWTRGSEFVMAGGIMGVFAAVNHEVERGHVANILLIFLIVFTFVSVSYRSAAAGFVIMFSLACGTIFSLAYMALRENGLNVNTLPVQSVGVGIGVDYAIYITDRIRQEFSWTGDLDEGIRRAIKTTGMAVSFTATTLIGGIVWWSFSSLRFQAEMAQLLSILMFVNMLGAIFFVPALFSIIRPAFFAASIAGAGEAQPAAPAEIEKPTASAVAAEGNL